jgi:hypothetical protein
MTKKKFSPGQEQLIELLFIFCASALLLYALWAILAFLRHLEQML